MHFRRYMGLWIGPRWSRRMDRSGSPVFGMDRGYGSACGFRVWIGALHFDSQPHVPTNSSDVKWVWICLVIARCTSAHLHGFQSSNQALIVDTCGYWYAEYWIHLNTVEIPVQIGPEGLGAPFCSYRTASPRCPSYKLAEPNVHRGRFLLQNGSPSWPLVTKWVTDFARLASARIRWLDLPFTEWWGLGVAILALS